ncbi:MAG: hypothetical protein ACT4O1_17620 [Gemmatimonadota bacterium]
MGAWEHGSMGRTFTDDNLLVWEAYPSAGSNGETENPNIVFNCLSDRLRRPREVGCEGDEADAERVVVDASEKGLLELFRRSREID